MQHQYVERDSGRVRTEQLFGDRLIRLLYSGVRENAPLMFRLFTSSWSSSLLGLVNYDLPLGGKLAGSSSFLRECGIDLDECREPERLTTARRVFERKIRYEECRPMPTGSGLVVSPADARVIVGSFRETSVLFLKDKFFGFEEMLGADRPAWLAAFEGGDFAVFRLTPDKYHYNHLPVSGVVADVYELDGTYHSCNPGAVVSMVTPYSKNRRTVTVIDTDVPGGSKVGMVAMIEVVALMIGEIVQCYSESGYDDPRPLARRMFVQAGQPKSLYRPGSSTDVLLFQKDRIAFATDLTTNLHRPSVESRFSAGFERPLVETEVRVRSLIAAAAQTAAQEIP